MAYEAYKARLNARGTSPTDTLKQATKLSVNLSIKNSASYKKVLIDGAEYDSRVIIDSKNYTKATILFRPETVVHRGSVVQIEGKNWLATDREENDVYPKLSLSMCNNSLKWMDSSGAQHEAPCVIMNPSSFSVDESQSFNIPDGAYRALAPYTPETQLVDVKQRFIINGKVYEVIGVDNVTNIFDGYGYMVFVIKYTTKTADDNFADRVADNKGGGVKW